MIADGVSIKEVLFSYNGDNKKTFDFFLGMSKHDYDYGYTKMDISDIHFSQLPPNQCLIQFTKSFFTKGFYYHNDQINRRYLGQHHYYEFIESFCKMVWFMDDLLKDGKYKNPISVNYKPEINLNPDEPPMGGFVGHPGMIRCRAYYSMFRYSSLIGNYIDVLLFKPKNVDYKIDVPIDSYQKLIDSIDGELTSFFVIPNEYRLYPQLFIDNKFEKTIKDYFKKIKKFYLNTKIKANFRTEEFRMINFVEVRYDVQVEIYFDKYDENERENLICMALHLLPLEINIDWPSMKINKNTKLL